ncbi:MAG: hypothetical protein HFE86_00825 [Clostridiales bacterium]|nr:hypothetical protein [Clostridiales bacterium]
MCDDRDMKIAGASFPASAGFSDEAEAVEFNREKQSGVLDRAKELGRRMVGALQASGGEFAFGAAEEEDALLTLQRQILLAFVVTVGVERFCISKLAAETAHQSFYNCMKQTLPALYQELSGGDFSFYYLAYRRGGDVERRMGQTFAMLCARDGDPVYQELGEALYCWFMSVVEKKAWELEIGRQPSNG